MTRSRGLAGRAALCLSFLLLLAAPVALAFDADFNFYPKNAQSCLLDSAKASKCQGDSAKELNACLCGNGGSFVIRSAQCLGAKDKKDVNEVYDTMASACATSDTPLTVDKDDFLDAASDAANDSSSTKTSTKTTSTKTSTSTSSATKTPSSTSASASSSGAPATTSSTASPSATPPDSSKGGGDKKKLSTAGTIGIAAGVSVAGVAIIAALAFFLVRRRKRNNTPDEAHPMLPHEKYGGGGSSRNSGPTTFPPHDPSPSLGSNGFEHETKSHYSVSTFGGAPLHQQQQQQRQSYAALSNASPDPQQQQQQQQQHNFLSAWEPPTGSSYNTSPSNSSQYVGPYAAPQGAVELPPQTHHQVIAELPPQTQPASNVFELDSHGVAVPPPPPQQQQPPRDYKPYVPR
ncbi:hypothetical protein PWT90_01864 [Aphanocladium album]|nr:hypothetical protein PWT90_01864 [Aphanocladium album]